MAWRAPAVEAIRSGRCRWPGSKHCAATGWPGAELWQTATAGEDSRECEQQKRLQWLTAAACESPRKIICCTARGALLSRQAEKSTTSVTTVHFYRPSVAALFRQGNDCRACRTVWRWRRWRPTTASGVTVVLKLCLPSQDKLLGVEGGGGDRRLRQVS